MEVVKMYEMEIISALRDIHHELMKLNAILKTRKE